MVASKFRWRWVGAFFRLVVLAGFQLSKQKSYTPPRWWSEICLQIRIYLPLLMVPDQEQGFPPRIAGLDNPMERFAEVAWLESQLPSDAWLSTSTSLSEGLCPRHLTTAFGTTGSSQWGGLGGEIFVMVGWFVGWLERNEHSSGECVHFFS